VQRRLTSTFRALGVRNYRLFATGQLISLLGGWIQIIAQDWLVLALSHNSPTALGFVTALQFAPILLLTLYGGQLADRFDKRHMLIVANAVYLVFASVMGALVISGAVQLWHVYVFATLWGTVSAIETPTRQAFASEMVGKELLPNALALSAATFNSARIVGPAIAGVLIYLLGTGPAFVFNAVTFIAPMIALSRMNPTELYRTAKTSRVSASDARIIDALRYVRSRRDLVVPMTLMAIAGLLAFNFQLTLAVLAKNVFHTSSASFGLLTTAVAVGALVGALSGSNRRSRPSSWKVICAAIAFSSLEIVVGFAPTFLLTMLLLVPAGFSMIFFAQAANQRVQMGTSSAFRGRVMALYVLVFMGTTPIGGPLVGYCAEKLGPRSAIWLGGLGTLIAALVILAFELRNAGMRPSIDRRLRMHLVATVTPPADPDPERVPAGRLDEPELVSTLR
jgi:MFS family permease